MSENENLPRAPQPMCGLWPNSINREMLNVPVETDEQANMVLDWIGWLEQRKAQVKTWCDRQMAGYDQAVDVLAGSPAVKSLAEYVKRTGKGKKTLELPGGTIKVRVQRNVLQVYNRKAAQDCCPEACYEYQAPPSTKLSNEKLKTALFAIGGKLFADLAGEKVLVAEVLPEVETVSTQPNSDPHGAVVAGLLMENDHEDPDNGEQSST